MVAAIQRYSLTTINMIIINYKGFENKISSRQTLHENKRLFIPKMVHMVFSYKRANGNRKFSKVSQRIFLNTLEEISAPSILYQISASSMKRKQKKCDAMLEILIRKREL